ncbi:MAG: hypothetical protein CM15mP3_08510 [Candidatus Poseidoniales archaeon]|nr:MAG: hypothetical protein CM15mP3_08510 [Candidatus Poseidoniales archaeon]
MCDRILVWHMGHAIAVCGMPGSGKGEFARIIADNGIPVRSMGDMVRAEVEARGLTGSPTVFGEVAADLRAKHGDDILAKRLADEVSKLMLVHPIVLIDGMRGTQSMRCLVPGGAKISPALPLSQIKMLGLNAFKKGAGLKMAIDSSFKSEKTENLAGV